MGEMRILDETGDSKLIWDSENKDEVDAAKAQFNSLKKKGFTAYNVKKDGKAGTVMREFDPDAGKIIMTPAKAGG